MGSTKLAPGPRGGTQTLFVGPDTTWARHKLAPPRVAQPTGWAQTKLATQGARHNCGNRPWHIYGRQKTLAFPRRAETRVITPPRPQGLLHGTPALSLGAHPRTKTDPGRPQRARGRTKGAPRSHKERPLGTAAPFYGPTFSSLVCCSLGSLSHSQHFL